jgi:outer membrane protein assembly factor BamB
VSDLKHTIPHRRNQAVIKEEGEVARPNPNSAALWHYAHADANGNGKTEFEETMHRTCGTAAIKDNLLFIADFSGLVHCLDATTGEPHWTHDMLAASWASPLIVDGKVYIGDEDGDICVFELSPKLNLISEVNMGSSVYSTPIVANNVLYISNKDHLFAIEADKKK